MRRCGRSGRRRSLRRFCQLIAIEHDEWAFDKLTVGGFDKQ